MSPLLYSSQLFHITLVLFKIQKWFSSGTDMQLPTHLIVGILIQEILTIYIPTNDFIRVLLIIICCFSSHFFVDAIAIITYHPPERENTKFWLYWHVFVYSAGIFIFILFLNPYWLGMLSAFVVDLWDWFFLRPIGNKFNKPDLLQRYGVHFIANKLRKPLIQVGVPNLGHNPYGIIPELILIVLFLGYKVIIILDSLG